MSVYKRVLSQNRFIESDELTYPFEERGLQFGDGIYEVIRVYNGHCYLLTEHVERLFRSAEAIRLQLPFSKEALKENLLLLLKENKVNEDAKVYLQVTRGSATRDHTFPNVDVNLYAYVQNMPRPMNELQNGVTTITTPDVRWENCYIKSLNLLPNVLAKQEAKEKGCFEAIFHRGSTVTECSSSNIFIVKNAIIYTHPQTNNILHGCVRARLKDLTDNLNIPFKESSFVLDDLYNADEVFLTSSTSEIMPIVKINDKEIDSGSPGSVTKMLQQAYEKDANISQSIFTSVG